MRRLVGTILLILWSAQAAHALPPPPPPPPPLSNVERDAQLRQIIAKIEATAMAGAEVLAEARRSVRNARETGARADWLSAREAAARLVAARRQNYDAIQALAEFSWRLVRDTTATAADHSRVQSNLKHWTEFYCMTEANVSAVFRELVEIAKP